MHQGLTLGEAREAGYEEALCLMHHGELEEMVRCLRAEETRVASLSFADPAEQQRLLTALGHRRKAAIERFHGRM